MSCFLASDALPKVHDSSGSGQKSSKHLLSLPPKFMPDTHKDLKAIWYFFIIIDIQ